MSPASDEGGWKASPIVGAVAVALILLAVILGITCSRSATTSTSDSQRPSSLPKGEGTVLICPHCGHERTISASANRRVVMRAMRDPCPNCDKPGMQPGIRCHHCGKAFLPVAAGTPPTGGGRSRTPEEARAGRGRDSGGAGIRCPHCGKDPYSK
jgi:hypothetical protein